MNNRLFKEKKSDLDSNFPSFSVLNGEDVISAKLSDHHPLIHNGILFWNIMMQCNMRKETHDYNNGFGIIENEAQYLSRLRKIAHVIAEIAANYPIDIITVCEGPNQFLHRHVFFSALKNFNSMKRFFINNEFHHTHETILPKWGMMMLYDTSYNVDSIHNPTLTYLYPKLIQRIQIWKLTHGAKTRYVALAHFPFRNDATIVDHALLSSEGKNYHALINQLMKNYANEPFVFCADFNSNPYLIGNYQDRVLDKTPHYNSILYVPNKKSQPSIKKVTVDGILLSRHEKQKYFSQYCQVGLFNQLKWEYSLNQRALLCTFDFSKKMYKTT